MVLFASDMAEIPFIVAVLALSGIHTPYFRNKKIPPHE